jgi:hypothetical protein
LLSSQLKSPEEITAIAHTKRESLRDVSSVASFIVYLIIFL